MLTSACLVIRNQEIYQAQLNLRMLISASLLIRDQKIVKEVSAEWGDIEETGEDAGREENVLEDYLEEERHRLFQSGSAYQCILVIKNQKESQAQPNLGCLSLRL